MRVMKFITLAAILVAISAFAVAQQASAQTPPTDLTGLAQKSGGKYRSAHVASVIRGQAALPSDGSQDMPVWGPLFSSISPGQAK